MSDEHSNHGRDDGGAITAAELDRERLRTYLDWGEADIPGWWLVIYGAAIALWIASYDLGRVWGTIVAIVFAFTMGILIRVATAKTHVSTPRFRGMPPALRRTFVLPSLVIVACLATAAAVSSTVDDPSYTLVGVVVGTVVAVSVGLQGYWYRSVARRIAAEEGLER